MNEPIISRETIRARGYAAFVAGTARDGHNLPWNCAALHEWLTGWDEAKMQQGEAA